MPSVIRSFFALLFLTAYHAVGLAQDSFVGQGMELDQAFERARKAVVRVVGTLHTGSVTQGTAVLLKVIPEGEQTYGYFLTCAHVLAGAARTPALYRLDNSRNAAVLPVAVSKQPIKFLFDQDHDLLILRVPLQQPDAMAEVDVEPVLPQQFRNAFGFGYGIFAPDNLHAVMMRVGTSVSAESYLTSEAKDKDWLVLQATRERFASGMSGGPLLTEAQKGVYKLVAVMFATDPNGAELTVPARYVAPLLKQALEKKQDLDDFTPERAADAPRIVWTGSAR